MRRASREAQRGAAMIIALLLMMLLFLLGAALLTVSEAETVIATNDVWSEGAFYAAEAAVQQAIDQISLDPASASLVVPVTALGDQFTFRSGARDDSTPQPPVFMRTTHRPGFSAGESNGYTSSSYSFDVLQIHGTGQGPRNSVREIQVQFVHGPRAQ